MTTTAKQNVEELPKGWTRINLGNQEFFELIMGQSPLSETYTTKKTGLPFLQGNADFGVFHPNPKTYCTEPLKVAEKGDVLISVRAPVGEVNIATEKYCIGRGLGAIRSKDKHDSKYLYYYINHYRHDLQRISAGSTFKAITKDDLEKFSVTLPPSEEKQKIISILTTIDDAIQRSRQAATETEHLKAGVMHELMTKGIGHREFREDPDVGMVPKEWDVVRLISVLSEKTKYGYSGMQVQSGSKVRVLTLSAVTNNEISEKNSKECSHDPYLINEYWIKKDDIFIGRSNTRDLVGLTAIYRGTNPFAIFADLLIRVRANKTKITPDFLSYYLVSAYVRKYFAASSKGTSGSMKKIDTSIIEELKVRLPALPEQQQITTILSTLDSKLILQRQRTSHYEHLKQGLMDELLTGKRRALIPNNGKKREVQHVPS